MLVTEDAQVHTDGGGAATGADAGSGARSSSGKEPATGSHDISRLALERLEAEIGELAAQIHAATCRWLVLVAEFDRREGFLHWSCRSCADWLSLRCGIAPGAAREKVRVARSLAELPLVRTAFSEGRLSYSKVRAVSRVAGPGSEAALLDLALHATAAQLERIVRGYRRGAAAAVEGVNAAQRERFLSWSWDDDGSLVFRGRLPAEDGELLLRALEVARDAQHRVSAETLGEATPGQETPSPQTPSPQTPSRETPSPQTPSRETPSPQTPSRETPSRETPSRETPSRETPSPPENGERPAHSNADALVSVADASLAASESTRSGGDRYQLVVHTDVEALSGDSSPDLRADRSDGPTEDSSTGGGEFEHGGAVCTETVRRIACDASIVVLSERDGRPLSVGRKTRTVPPALRRALRSRDRCCRFPGCAQRRFVDAHHLHHWARGGETALGNLVLLCRRHHRLLHEGGYRVEQIAGGGLDFTRPDGRSICPPPRSRRVNEREIRAGNARAGLAIGPDTAVALSHGDRFSLDLTIGGLLAADDAAGHSTVP